MNKNILVGLVVFVVLIAAVAAYAYKTNVAAPAPADNAISQDTSTTATSTGTTTQNIGGVHVEVPEGVRIEPVAGAQIVQPGLGRTVTYSSDLAPDAVASLKVNIASTTLALKSAPTNGQLWLKLGLYYKIAGDYKAAEEVWVYLTKAIPSSVVPHRNLGDLYQNFLHEYAKAEVEYKAAIKQDPTYIEAYRNLFMMYRGQYKQGTTAAADIIAQGLKANPNNSDLLELKKQL